MLWSQWFNWRNEYLTPPYCFCYTGKPSVRCLAWVCMVSFLTWLLCRDSSENLCHNLMCTSLEMRCVDRACKFCSVGYRRFLLCISGYFLTTFVEWMVERIIRNSADARPLVWVSQPLVKVYLLKCVGYSSKSQLLLQMSIFSAYGQQL